MTDIVIAKGDSCNLKMVGSKGNVIWKSSNKKIVTVSKGSVKAKKCGTAILLLKYPVKNIGVKFLLRRQKNLIVN